MGNGLTEVRDSFQHYQVFGYTADQIVAQMAACSPVAPWGGEASYAISTRFTYASSGGSCSTTSVKVGLHTTAIVPTWSNTPQAEAGLAARWNTYSAALMTHEQGHVDIAEQYASKTLSDLQAIHSAATCSALSSQLTTKANADIAALSQAEVDYDNQTQHGITQGAVL